MTYSIVGRDPDAGLMGVAVQSHHFSVGAHVIGAEPGVGVIAAQSYADRGYVVRGLTLLRGGFGAGETLVTLTEEDPRRGRAQVAILTPEGPPATHTGDICVAEAGHVIGAELSAQANMVQSPRVWERMAETFEEEGDDLMGRLLAALQSAEVAGGDWRGRQSAAVTVVSTSPEVMDPVIDIRVDDHPDPITELRRLDLLRRASQKMADAFDLAADGDVDKAIALLDEAQETYGPANVEPRAWSSVILARAGRESEAATRLDDVGEGWLQMFRRLPRARLLDQESMEGVSKRLKSP